MPDESSLESLDFNIVETMEERESAPERDTPFRIAVMGDFSGRASRQKESDGALTSRPVEIDRDNFDEVMRKVGVELHLNVSSAGQLPIVIKFAELDDFHPDHIYDRLDLFQMLRQTRQGLNNDSTFESAAAQVRDWFQLPPATHEEPATPKQIAAPAEADISGSDLLSQMLEAGSSAVAPTPAKDQATKFSDLNLFLQDVVAPHFTVNNEAQQAELVDVVDAATSQIMRSILHHPDFQALEAAWRGLYFLISRVETDTNLKIYLLDATKKELTADLHGADGLRRTGSHRLFVEQTVETLGGQPWSVLAGNYAFDATREDAELLGRIAQIARQAGAPFIAGANARLVGAESLAQTPEPDDWKIAEGDALQEWEKLRHQPEAVYVGLALPRFLLRLPYGENTETTERFDFEETSEGEEPQHEHYLWGNPAFVCAYLLASAFSQNEWEMSLGDVLNVEGLPIHIYEIEDGESQAKPCAEVLLTEHAAVKILSRGIMPLLSFRERDHIRLARFQSISDPPTRLAGPWA